MTTRYTINPSLRLCTWCLVVGWHEVKDSLLQSESIFSCEGRSIYTKGDRCMIMAQVNEKRIDFYYCHDTKFDNRNIQSWLRSIIKNKILDLANIELPKRLHYWEKEKNLYARQVILNSEKYYEFDIHPYFVKAFKKRWYVVAYSPGTNDIRCYALDRMENVIISEEVFKMPENLEPAEYFKDCFGIINKKDSEVQKVVLKVDAFQSNYIRNLPLHESQKETERTEEYSIFEYHLKPEFDFEQEIFSNMDAMEVLEPLWLREEVKERIKILASKYL